MPYLLLRLPKTENIVTERPDHCPHCGSTILQRWGRITHSGEDHGFVFRYRCDACRRTFHHSSNEKVLDDRIRQVQKVAGLAWAMGMSCREVVGAFARMDIHLSRMTVWREGRQFVEPDAEGENNQRRFNIDQEYVKGVSKNLGVVVIVDFGQGHALVLGTLDEYDPRVVKGWLEQRLQGWQVDVLVVNTAALNHYSLLTTGNLAAMAESMA